jgi:hypothetical protein
MSYAPLPAIIGRSFAYAGMLVLLSTHFALNFAKTGTYFLDLNKFTSGQAPLPYQYRVLTAPILKALVGFFTSINLKNALHNCPEYVATPEQQAYFVVNVISVIIAFGTFLLIAKEVFTSRAEIFGAAILFVIMAYFVFILNTSHQYILPYDLPSLAFTQVCCFLVLRRRWIILFVVFALAAVNRETILLIIFFVATRVLTGSETRRTGIAVVATLSFIWLAVKSLLFFHFAGAASSDAALGGLALFKLFPNLATVIKPWQWPSLLPLVAPIVLTLRLLFEKPSKEALEWIAPYLLGFSILLLVAVIVESRAFGDLIGFSTMSVVFYFKERNIFSDKKASGQKIELQS